MNGVYYPINNFDPLMKGLVIGGLGIFHVFLAQFAIGGGMLMTYFEWRSQTGRGRYTREFVDKYFKILVLISFVLGAVTGVAMWFSTIQVSAQTIGLMVDQFHWIWAVEWTFFCTEVFSGYMFYRYGERLNNRARITLLAIYSTAAWFSLFWINGILSWQLTPGAWIESGNVWQGFFNPTFWPSLFYRTVASMAIAALVACLAVNYVRGFSREAQSEIIHTAAHFLMPMILMPFLAAWFYFEMPFDSRQWITGASPAMMLFMNIAVGASLLIGLYSLAILTGRSLFISGPTAALLVVLAWAATAGGEFVREGARKPYTVRQRLYSNAVKRDDVARLRVHGCTTDDPYPVQNAERFPNDQVRLGMKVYRNLCSVCHTLEGTNALRDLTATWDGDQLRMNVAKLQLTKPFMPPFAGTPEELEALVQLLLWMQQGEPKHWREHHDAATLAKIKAYMDSAGPGPGNEQMIRNLERDLESNVE